MAFNVTSELTAEGLGKITLQGELDASVATQFKAEVEKLAAQHARRLVLLLQDLEYMSSAGVRVLVFAKQKMGPGVDIYGVAPQDSVKETIIMTGLQHSLILLEQYDAGVIEALQAN